jgi:diamine N-acetyltransferase
MDYNIRKATPEDYKYIFELVNEFSRFQKMPEKVTISVDQMIEQKDHFNCLVAENNKGMIIGYTNYSIIYFSWVGKSIYLDDLYVKPSFRGNGIGIKLMNEVFNIAKKEKCNRV